MTEREYMEILNAQAENEAYWQRIRHEYHDAHPDYEADPENYVESRSSAVTCVECEDTGWRDVKSPDDRSGHATCSCATGQAIRTADRDRKARERSAEDAALAAGEIF